MMKTRARRPARSGFITSPYENRAFHVMSRHIAQEGIVSDPRGNKSDLRAAIGRDDQSTESRAREFRKPIARDVHVCTGKQRPRDKSVEF